MVTYIPPQDEDFEVLEKTNKPVRENAKGEKNKYEKKKLPSKAKFPLRTLEIDEKFLQYNQEFFVEYDFFFMLNLVVVVLFMITSTIKIFNPDLVETNLVFYMMIMTLSLGLMNLTKNSFALGFCRFTDETKVELLMALKAIGLVFLILHYNGFNELFDVDFEKAH